MERVMSNNTVIDVVFVITIFFFIALLISGIYMTGREDERKQWQKDAVKAGMAEYISTEDGSATWRWKNGR
jgi:hypothetical protein